MVHPRRKPTPMDEENFPTRSPTRDAVEREMREPENLAPPLPMDRKKRPLKEFETFSDEDM